MVLNQKMKLNQKQLPIFRHSSRLVLESIKQEVQGVNRLSSNRPACTIAQSRVVSTQLGYFLNKLVSFMKKRLLSSVAVNMALKSEEV